MKVYLVNSLFPELSYAKKISKIVLEKKLAACVNVNREIKSFFFWKKKFYNENEIELSFKTSLRKVKKLIDFIEKHHPYECPYIATFHIEKLNKKYSAWVTKQTK